MHSKDTRRRSSKSEAVCSKPEALPDLHCLAAYFCPNEADRSRLPDLATQEALRNGARLRTRNGRVTVFSILHRMVLESRHYSGYARSLDLPSTASRDQLSLGH